MGRKRVLTDEERKARKRESNARWLANNPDYYKNYFREHRDSWNPYQCMWKYKDRMKKAKEAFEKETTA